MKVDLEAVSRALREMRSSGATLDQIAGRLRLGHAAHKSLRAALQTLVREGVVTYQGKRYRPQRLVEHPPEKTRTEGASHGRRRAMPAALLVAQSQRRAGTSPEAGPPQPGHDIVGTLHLKTEGYGFVSPLVGGGGRENDVFLPPGRSRDALDGDVVRVRTSRGRDGRTVGEVAEVVERRRQLLLGRYRMQGRNIWVEPHDRTFVHPIPVRRDPRAKEGEFVKVRLIREPGGVSGEVIARLGASGDPRFEILARAHAEGLADQFDRAT